MSGVRRCAKCGSDRVWLIEGWSASMSYDPDEIERLPDGRIVVGLGFTQSGDPTGQYDWHCYDCDHQWSARIGQTILIRGVTHDPDEDIREATEHE